MPISAGDIAFVHYSATDPDSFSFVAMVDIPGSEVISFTDAGVRSDIGQMSPSVASEGQIDWTAPVAGLTAGTVVTFTATTQSFNSGIPGTVSHGSHLVSDNDLFLSTGGDQLIAFQGAIGSPTYIAALNANETDWNSTLTTSNSSSGSVLPTGLVKGDTAIHQTTEVDNMYYNGPSSFATPALGRAAIHNVANWTTDNVNSLAYGGPSSFSFCFGAGTLIATPAGEVAVETLQIGDPVTTQDGRVVPVKWIGRQTILKRFALDYAQLVRIRAGTLGAHRDLCVTGDHGLVVDGFVINASALVNGYEIDFVPLDETPDRQVVYHVETEAHDIILAEGVASETYLDQPGRRAFDNYQEYINLYGAEKPMRENPLPRISAMRLVPDRLRSQLVSTDTAFRGLRGRASGGSRV